MSPPDIQIEVFGKTDVGLIRDHNEDRFLVADLGGALRASELDDAARVTLGERGALFLVCDGMGGAAAGEVASQMAVDAIAAELAAVPPQPRDGFARALVQSIEVANDRIFIQSRDNQNERGMGTTCTAAACVDNTLLVAQVGDSRCYVLRDGVLAQVTKDQSLAWQLIEAGAMTPEEAKAFEHANIILQALGVQDRVEVVLSQVPLRRGDLLLLCSDGLHGPVGDDEIEALLRDEPDLRRATEALIQRALDRDGPDNITVVLARFDGAGLRAPDPANPEDKVGFVPFNLPLDRGALDGGATPRPGLLGEASGGAESAARETQRSLDARSTTPPSLPVQAEPARAPLRIGRPTLDEAPRPTRSVLALLFLALLAAAAGAVFVLKCEHEDAMQLEGPP